MSQRSARANGPLRFAGRSCGLIVDESTRARSSLYTASTNPSKSPSSEGGASKGRKRAPSAWDRSVLVFSEDTILSISRLIDAKSCVSASRVLAQASSISIGFDSDASRSPKGPRTSKGASAGLTTAPSDSTMRAARYSSSSKTRPAQLDSCWMTPDTSGSTLCVVTPSSRNASSRNASARISRCTCLLNFASSRTTSPMWLARRSRPCRASGS